MVLRICSLFTAGTFLQCFCFGFFFGVASFLRSMAGFCISSVFFFFGHEERQSISFCCVFYGLSVRWGGGGFFSVFYLVSSLDTRSVGVSVFAVSSTDYR